MDNCRFCERVSTGDFDFANDDAVAFADTYPLSPGHTLVIPRQHEADLFDLDAAVAGNDQSESAAEAKEEAASTAGQTRTMSAPQLVFCSYQTFINSVSPCN